MHAFTDFNKVVDIAVGFSKLHSSRNIALASSRVRLVGYINELLFASEQYFGRPLQSAPNK